MRNIEYILGGLALIAFACYWPTANYGDLCKDLFAQLFTASVALFAANRIARSVSDAEHHSEVVDDVAKGVVAAAERLLGAGKRRMEKQIDSQQEAVDAAASLTQKQGLLAICCSAKDSRDGIRRQCMDMKRLLTDDSVDSDRIEEATIGLGRLHTLLLKVRLKA